MNKFTYPNGVEVAILPPAKRLLRIIPNEKLYGKAIELAFPYMVFATFPKGKYEWVKNHFSGGYIFTAFSNDSITREDIESSNCKLWLPPFEYGHRGCGAFCVEGSHAPILDIESGMIFFFQNDNCVNNHLSRTSLRSLQKWERLTQEAGNDLSFITKVDWDSKIEIHPQLGITNG